jgi:septum formation protein
MGTKFMHRKLYLPQPRPTGANSLAAWACLSTLPTPQTDEPPLPGETPETLALRLSEAKARAVVADFPDALIIGSDQVAETGRARIRQTWQPRTSCRPVARTLSGKTVNFFTGLCVLDAKNR